MHQVHFHAVHQQLHDCYVSDDSDAISTARVSADHTYCHVVDVDGARGRSCDGVHGASDSGVDGGVEIRALHAVVEDWEELADAGIGQAASFVP